MVTASPKQKNRSWNKGDDLRLYKLFQYRKVNPKETMKKHIEPVRLEHFPQIPYRNFRVNLWKKIRAVGDRAGEARNKSSL